MPKKPEIKWEGQFDIHGDADFRLLYHEMLDFWPLYRIIPWSGHEDECMSLQFVLRQDVNDEWEYTIGSHPGHHILEWEKGYDPYTLVAQAIDIIEELDDGVQ